MGTMTPASMMLRNPKARAKHAFYKQFNTGQLTNISKGEAEAKKMGVKIDDKTRFLMASDPNADYVGKKKKNKDGAVETTVALGDRLGQ